MNRGRLNKLEEPLDSGLEDEYFDAAFEQAFDEAFQQAATAPSASRSQSMQQSWHKVQREIEILGAHKRRIRTLKLSGLVAASVMIGAVLFSLPTGTQAVSPLVQSIKNWGNGMKSIIVEEKSVDLSPDPSTAKTPPPPDMESNYSFHADAEGIPVFELEKHVFRPVAVTEEIAREGFLGEFILSKAIPARFDKMKYELLLDTENPVNPDDYYESDMMRIRYSIQGKSDTEELIQINYEYVRPGQSLEKTPLQKSKAVKLTDGNDALVYVGPPFNSIQWMTGTLSMSLFGTVTEEEMIAIANDFLEQNAPVQSK
ncbi:hypothetical protein [Paenibacillus sp. FSL R7-0652]|uniref:DUF4367 domain-containing protein n=1 Tax=Paenibacillus sp. AN1007 TaxID=3151385 RepID=A0AAU8NJ35_9BACL